ncbi:transposase [Bradyrhizobium sp. HKCCYLS20291]|uniref:transposase n=1 Tax=Bradyrhizobium sp. HKCCYLS20291 TaxID=3420766 RepID=UPI003EC04036
MAIGLAPGLVLWLREASLPTQGGRHRGLTPAAPPAPVRRFFSDKEKLAITKETELPGAKVSAVARKHGIATGLLFRWRAQFGIAQRKRYRLARVVLRDDIPAPHTPCVIWCVHQRA